VRVILDHSTEELEDADAWEGNLQSKIRMLTTARERMPETARFVPVKLTALGSPLLLEEMTSVMHHTAQATAGSCANMVDPRPRMSEEGLEQLEGFLGRLRELCKASRSSGIPLLLDAEQSHRQPAIDFIARQMCMEFNRPSPSGSEETGTRDVTVYNTFQMYLKGKQEHLEAELAAAEVGGYAIGCKLVRGAYMSGEAARAAANGEQSPVCASKQVTDREYNKAVEAVLKCIAQPGALKAAVVVATHNRHSLEVTTQAMANLGLPRQHPYIHMAQIMGMCDNLTFALGIGGYNALKLVPYGDFDEVLPWLLRRLIENQDMLGGCQNEVHVINKEIIRRRFGLAA